jgi:1-acyl-sn-glycerol-3-phosphate acyltransferase
LDELSREDYDLFKSIMHEPFLIFPEGSRSYVGKDGSVTMKYVSPRFVQAYLRPDDVVLPISLVGGSDIGNSWRLKPANIGLCVGEPIEVSANMIEDYDSVGVGIMRKVAALPNIKEVRFDEQVQAGKKLDSQAA